MVNQLVPLLAAAANALLGLFILSRAPKGKVQQAFACFALSVGLWIAGVVVLGASTSLAGAHRAVTLAFAGSNLIAATMAWLAAVFPGGPGRVPGPAIKIFSGIGLLLACLSPTSAYVSQIHHVGWGWEVTNGPLFSTASLYFCFSTVYFIVSVAMRWRRTRGLERLQTQYLLLGASISLTIGIITNLLVPLLLNTARYQQVGPVGSLFFVFFSGYAIAKYRLLDISWVIQRGMAYGLSLGALAITFVLAGIGVDKLANSYLPIDTNQAQAIVAMVIAIAFQPVYQAFLRLVNILFFRHTYDYPRTLRSVSRGMTAVLDLQQLREHLAGSVTQFMQVEKATLAIRRSDEWEVDLNGPLLSEPYSPMLLLAMQQGQILLREEEAQNEHDPNALAIAANMDSLRIDVAVPLIFKDELVGILFVGPKRSGSIFSDEDIALLSTLANQAAIALRNAQLYLEVQMSQQYTEAILEQLDSAVLTVGMDGVPIVANEAARKLLPRQEGELLLPPILRSVVARVFETHENHADLEFDLLDANLSSTPVVATVCPFIPENGIAQTALVVIRDISVLRRLEAERLRVERLSSMSKVARTLAHEIRNPLASIKTFCQLLPEKYLDVEFREGFAQIAFQEVERINSLVGNLLATDKPAEGVMESTRLEETVGATVKFLQPMFLERHLHLTYECAPDLPRIRGDKSQLRQLFLNLLLNAEQAAPKGSTIKVRIMRGYDDEIISEVINRGEPIPMEDLPILFEPFFTTKEEGTGLGLTVVKQVATRHGGEISVQSSVESGTVFRLTLPAERVRT